MSRNGFKITWHDIWPHILWLMPLLIGIRFDDWIDHQPSRQELVVRGTGWVIILTGFAILKRRESPADQPAYKSALWVIGWAIAVAMSSTILGLLPLWAIFPFLLAVGVVCYILGGRSIARRMKREAGTERCSL